MVRLLVVDDKVASRLTLRTLLEAAGYLVDVAASGVEAIAKIDINEYQLVLSNLHLETRGAGERVLQYARAQRYRPATASVTAYHEKNAKYLPGDEQQISVDTREVADLVGKVADLIAMRATRRSQRAVRLATLAVG